MGITSLHTRNAMFSSPTKWTRSIGVNGRSLLSWSSSSSECSVTSDVGGQGPQRVRSSVDCNRLCWDATADTAQICCSLSSFADPVSYTDRPTFLRINFPAFVFLSNVQVFSLTVLQVVKLIIILQENKHLQTTSLCWNHSVVLSETDMCLLLGEI